MQYITFGLCRQCSGPPQGPTLILQQLSNCSRDFQLPEAPTQVKLSPNLLLEKKASEAKVGEGGAAFSSNLGV